jgi:hypothetical protein
MSMTNATVAVATLAPRPTLDSHASQAGRSPTTGRDVFIGLLLFAAVWLSHTAYTSLSPPMDNIEQLNWVHSLEWGYFKHPPLPTWLIWLPAHLLGASAWTSYGVGAACTLAAMGLLWRLLVRLRGRGYAGAALLAALCITYYNGRLYYYNHNVVLMLLSTASAALCWQAFAERQLRWWIGLGVALGLGALTKYQIAVTVASVLVFAVHQRAWRDAAHRVGGLLAALVALLMFVPHIEWLRVHDFGPIRYAVESSLGARVDGAKAIAESLHWLADQVLNRALPALVLLGATALMSRGRRPEARALRSVQPGGHRDSARALLFAWGLVPLLFMPFVGVVFGAELQLQWGTPFLLFLVPAVMELFPLRVWRRADPRAALTAFVFIQVLLLVLSQLTSSRGPVALRDHHWRTFDSALLAELVAGPARVALGGPIRIVIGAGDEAGALALQLPEHPLVLIDGRLDRSPWVSKDLLRRCGAVQLGSELSMPGGRPVGAAFPGQAWRVVLPDAEAPDCPGDMSAAAVQIGPYMKVSKQGAAFDWPSVGGR